MAEPARDPEMVLCEEILADAERQGERELRRARQGAAEALEKAGAAAAAEREATLEQARTGARRARELELSTVAVEINRMRAAKVEALLQRVHDEARSRLSSLQDRECRDLLPGLVAEALTRMDGDHFILELGPTDEGEPDEGWVEDVRRRMQGRELRLECVHGGNHAGPGVVVRDAARRQMWDNRLAARLDRLWPALRRELATATSLAEPVDRGGSTA